MGKLTSQSTLPLFTILLRNIKRSDNMLTLRVGQMPSMCGLGIGVSVQGLNSFFTMQLFNF